MVVSLGHFWLGMILCTWGASSGQGLNHRQIQKDSVTFSNSPASNSSASWGHLLVILLQFKPFYQDRPWREVSVRRFNTNVSGQALWFGGLSHCLGYPHPISECRFQLFHFCTGFLWKHPRGQWLTTRVRGTLSPDTVLGSWLSLSLSLSPTCTHTPLCLSAFQI